MMVSLIAAVLLGGQNRGVGQVELAFSRSLVTSLLQVKTGSISGVITGPNPNVVEGATLTALLRNPNSDSTLKSFSTVSDEKGCFRFAALPVGIYEIRVGTDEIIKHLATRVVVRSAENTKVEIQLRFIDECDGNFPEIRSLSDSDRAEIVKWIIEEAIAGQQTVMFSNPTLASDKIIILSTAKIESIWVPSIAGHNFLLLKPEEIQNRANRKGDYMYWQFDQIRPRGSCVVVSISHVWAEGTSSIETGQRTPLGESLFIYVFRRQSGKWIGKVISGSIS